MEEESRLQHLYAQWLQFTNYYNNPKIKKVIHKNFIHFAQKEKEGTLTQEVIYVIV